MLDSTLLFGGGRREWWGEVTFSLGIGQIRDIMLGEGAVTHCSAMACRTDWCVFQEKLLSMMDMVHDGFGFMLAFGDLAWVPFTFTCQSYYLASHPSDLCVFWIVPIILMNSKVLLLAEYVYNRKAMLKGEMFRFNARSSAILTVVGYYIFRKANSQKFAFRRNPYDPALSRKYFPLFCTFLPKPS